MLRVESRTFFDNEVLGHYPDWEPTSTQVNSWVCALQKFSIDVAIFALRNFYETSGGGFKKPKLGAIIDTCRVQQQRVGGNKKETVTHPVLLFALKCVENKVCLKRSGGIQMFFSPTPAKVPGDKSRILQAAEDLVEKFNRLYGGVWEIIRNWDTEELPF